MQYASRMRRVVLLALLLVAWRAQARATVAVEQSFPDLVHRAEVVAVGTVTGIQERWDAARQAPFTDVTFANLTVLKGNIDGTAMTLEFLGGHTPDGAILTISDIPQFIIGEKAVVFCAGNRQDFYPLVGLWQGRMRVTFNAQRGVETISDIFHRPIVGVRNGQLVKALSSEEGSAALTLSTLVGLIQQELGNSYEQR